MARPSSHRHDSVSKHASKHVRITVVALVIWSSRPLVCMDCQNIRPTSRGNFRPTWTSQEISIHGVREACLILVGRDDRHFLSRIEVLFRLIFQSLGESVAPCSIRCQKREAKVLQFAFIISSPMVSTNPQAICFFSVSIPNKSE